MDNLHRKSRPAWYAGGMEWTPYLPWPWQRFRLIDGSLSKRGAYLMRRKTPDGSFQYRLMTPAEITEDSDLHAM